MSNEIPYINDRRGLLFTINSDSNPVYQVESRSWADAANRWSEGDIPKEIRDKVASLQESGKPGAFARFLQGEDGVYVICEKNIRNLPDAADEEISVEPCQSPTSVRKLSPFDIVIFAKGGPARAEDGDSPETQEGEYYVIPCQSWGRFILEQPMRPAFVETTKEFLLLLDELHGKNFLSMAPDMVEEHLPPDFGEPTAAIEGLNCYVLNLSHFKP